MQNNLLPLPTDDEVLIRRAELPQYIGVAHQTLARWAHEGIGPKYIKVGAKMVAYKAGDVRSWLAAQERQNTSR